MRLRSSGLQPILLFDMKSGHISELGELSDAAAQGQPKSPRSILLVDDDRDICVLNADVLVRAGYKVDTAENGASAWKALRSNHYDALITDNTMPEITGLDLIKKLRSEDMTLPVILASGTVPAEELNQCPWLQVDALLPKPYSVAELLITVNRVLRATDSSH
jgi:DNA-binding response OmpR family regulator